ncbi:MAG TPA: phosphatidate cytidylyltransferase [Acidimicrobiales bacterium]|nr:phosphatidate cytidylyltransferase [Acidimicrobiales bacterium]
MSVPEEGLTVSGGAPEMPHWTDPPTGEVPRLRFEDDFDEGGEEDLEAWKSVGSRGARWRDERDWNDADQLDDLVSDVEPVGVLDSRRTEHSDLYSFDEDFERVTSRTGSHPAVDPDFEPDMDDFEPPAPPPRSRRGSGPSRSTGRRSAGRRPAAVGSFGDDEAMAAAPVGATRVGSRPGRTGVRPDGPGGPGRRPAGPGRPLGSAGAGRSGGDLGSRVGIGVGLVVLLAIAYAVGPKALVALTVVVVVAAAAEAYQMVRTAGFRPATLLGLVATAGCVLGSYWKGSGAIAVVSAFLIVGAMLWYVLRIVEARPLANVAVTVMVFVWVAVLGSFGAVMLGQPHGKGEFLGAIVVAVAADICAYGVGRWIGSRPLAASISPHKTVEGFVGGLIGALIAGAVIGKELAPWGGMKHGLLLGLVIGLITPVGDLFESMIKRDLGIKDSGTVLAGHGGLLDRFDGILVALPAAFFVITFFKL